MNLTGKKHQRERAGYRRTLTAHHRHRLVFEKKAVTVHAVTHPPAHQPAFIFKAQPVAGNSHGQNQGSGLKRLPAFRLYRVAAALAGLQIGHILIHEYGT